MNCIGFHAHIHAMDAFDGTADAHVSRTSSMSAMWHALKAIMASIRGTCFNMKRCCTASRWSLSSSSD